MRLLPGQAASRAPLGLPVQGYLLVLSMPADMHGQLSGQLTDC